MRAINSSRVSSVFSSSYFALAVRLFLGGTFVTSAVNKLPHHTEFVEIVRNHDLLPGPLATAYGNTLPWIELVMGVYFLLGILLRPSAVVTILLGISFMVANIDSIIEGEEHCSNCFGDMVSLPVEQAVVFDVLILIAALFLLFPGSGRKALSLESFFHKGNSSLE